MCLNGKLNKVNVSGIIMKSIYNTTKYHLTLYMYKIFPTHTKWYHSGISHMQPSYLLVFSGSQHKQYILNEVIIALYNVCLILTEGNTVNSVFCNHAGKKMWSCFWDIILYRNWVFSLS